MHQRYAQRRGTDSVLRTLAHLLATHSRATPKQAKEPNPNLIIQKLYLNLAVYSEGLNMQLMETEQTSIVLQHACASKPESQEIR